ncbi:MAG: hypothetical protein LBV79_02690, partial [Candidatus Adiutrix sp.]|nr:hypothetical protein [Candidatus Adiutrix sp.]
MRRNSFFLPALSLGLLYFSLSMGIIVVNLRGHLREGRADSAVLFHYLLVVLAALGLYALVRRGARRLGPLAVFLGLAGLGCLSVPFLPEGLFVRFFNGRPPMMAGAMAIFTPVALY